MPVIALTAPRFNPGVIYATPRNLPPAAIAARDAANAAIFGPADAYWAGVSADRAAHRDGVLEAVRPLSPEETAILLDRRGVPAMPGVPRPKIHAVMVTTEVRNRKRGGSFILRRAFCISRSMWKGFVLRASCGSSPWFSPDLWHKDQHDGCIYRGALFADGSVFDDERAFQ
jgi:hypothetical protein